MERVQKVIVVAGPTASGKSDFAVKLALSLSKGLAPFIDGEIISADSRQVYKGLDIGTGKITEGETNGIVHHMLSVYDLDEEVTVARFARDCSPIIEDIFTRNKTPIICGGTGQYIDALIYNTQLPTVAPNKKFREELEIKNSEELFEKLSIKDPARAHVIDKHNRVRVIRALEIIESLGYVPLQENQKLKYETEMYIMNPTRQLLRERVVQRLKKRFEIGMIDEVKIVIQRGYTSGDMKKFGLEYVTITKYLEGNITEEEMYQELTNKTMQYVKRQQTWNKKYLSFAKVIDVKE